MQQPPFAEFSLSELIKTFSPQTCLKIIAEKKA